MADSQLAQLAKPFPDRLMDLLAGPPPGKRRLRNRPQIERLLFRSAVQESGCWLWLGTHNGKGYGLIRSDNNGPVMTVHKAMWLFSRGPVPDGLEIDHICRVRNCVNPDHLQVLTHAENVRRRLPATHCGRGHPFDEANTYHNRGKRYCRKCNLINSLIWRERHGR